MQLDEIPQTSKTIINLISSFSLKYKSDKHQQELTNFIFKIISSEIPLHNTSEPSIINEIFSSRLESNDKKMRFQILLNKLSMITIKPNRRWALFYFLSQFSLLTREEKGFPKEISFFSKIVNSNNNKENQLNIDEYQIFNEKSQGQNQNPIHVLNDSVHKSTTNIYKKPISNEKNDRLVVDRYKTNVIITEIDIISDLIYVFQGIDGNYISYSLANDCYILNQIFPFKESSIEIINSLSELGWLYRKISISIEVLNKSPFHTQTLQAFIYSIKNELTQYFKLISYFKQSLNNEIDIKDEIILSKQEEKSEIKDNFPPKLTLKRMFLWTYDVFEKMKWIASLCDSCERINGILILSQIYSYVKLSNAYQLRNVLFTTSQPFFSYIKDWVIYGELNDIGNEYFIRINKIKEDDLIWKNKYEIIYDNIPNFSDKDFYIKVFQIGKIINYIKTYCENKQFSLNNIKERLYIEEEEIIKTIGKSEKITKKIQFRITFSKEPVNIFNDLSDFKREIDIIYKEVNVYLVNLLKKDFFLYENFKMIFNFLLLRQGDMMQYLMDLVINELNCQVNQINKHNLRSKLDLAITSSNAKKYKLNHNIDIKIYENIGDIGWDVFCLQYKVNQPLNSIFPLESMMKYESIFMFLWKLKRLEYSNNNTIWRKIMTLSRSLQKGFDRIRSTLNKVMLMNQHVIHFITTINNYITLEVLETQSKRLFEKLDSVKDMDEIIENHNLFVKIIYDQCLLSKENYIIYKSLNEIFDEIIKYKNIYDILNNSLFERIKREQEMKEISHELYDQDYINNENKTLEVSMSQIRFCFAEFRTKIINFLKILEADAESTERFKYLVMKIDFNKYYSSIELSHGNDYKGFLYGSNNERSKLKGRGDVIYENNINVNVNMNVDDEVRYKEDNDDNENNHMKVIGKNKKSILDNIEESIIPNNDLNVSFQSKFAVGNSNINSKNRIFYDNDN